MNTLVPVWLKRGMVTIAGRIPSGQGCGVEVEATRSGDYPHLLDLLARDSCGAL
ncbi:MAG: hypothetical protein GX216_10500 [Methanomicrobiales archaeon]|nr:hypothetical protein [Methanomicrobiales archaeon]